ncbi:hypothetical protein IWX49DRAFT_575928 [Phyllosticta citricarpa]
MKCNLYDFHVWICSGLFSLNVCVVASCEVFIPRAKRCRSSSSQQAMLLTVSMCIRLSLQPEHRALFALSESKS